MGIVIAPEFSQKQEKADMKKMNKQDNKITKNGKVSAFESLHTVSVLLVLYDIVSSAISYFTALWIRFDCKYTQIPHNYLVVWLKAMPIYAAFCVLIFWAFKLYQSVWRYASFTELKRLVVASAILGVSYASGISIAFGRMPIAYYVGGIIIQSMLSLAARFGYRFVFLERNRISHSHTPNISNRVMLIGAGSAGHMILRDLQTTKEVNDCVCCIIDDDKSKWGCFIDGVPIVGGKEDILLNVEKYKIEKIFLAIPSATAEDRRDILNICKETNCELKNLPGIYQFVTGNILASHMKDVAAEDLLGREPVKVEMKEIYESIKGKIILVTGGGGSIGSELCRKIAAHNPQQIIIFDVYENNAYAIQLELRDKYPNLNLKVIIGSVRDSRRINQIFETYRPDIVYHAAAHKHVPLMEDSPCEAIKNNAIGTYKTAYAAMANGCKRFVLISTDKAVNPTNIMGASKRLCEMIIQSFDRKIREGKAAELFPLHVHSEDEDGSMRDIAKFNKNAKTEFVAVRFGNVLGSNGSVVPLFKKQIAKGGPVTVTHPDVIRYFMTIPEAASLVLQAGTYAKGGEIFVLDMGSPVKIDTFARNLIKLSGLRPDVDIKIEYTGLRPGEKLYEEKLMSEEGLKTTPNHLIHIGSPIPFDTDAFLKQLQILMEAAYAGKENEIRALVEGIVTTYHPVGICDSKYKCEAFEKQIEIVENKNTKKENGLAIV